MVGSKRYFRPEGPSKKTWLDQFMEKRLTRHAPTLLRSGALLFGLLGQESHLLNNAKIALKPSKPSEPMVIRVTQNIRMLNSVLTCGETSETAHENALPTEEEIKALYAKCDELSSPAHPHFDADDRGSQSPYRQFASINKNRSKNKKKWEYYKINRATSSLRSRIALPTGSYFHMWRCGELANSSPRYWRIHAPQIRLSLNSYGTSTPLQTPPPGLYQLSVLLDGQPRIWIVVAEAHTRLVEYGLLRYRAKIMGTLEAQPCCSQWINHLSLWLSLPALSKWKLSFKIMVQKPRELMVLAPGCLYQVFDTGACASEEVCYSDAAGAMRATSSLPCNEKCGALLDSNDKPITLSWAETEVDKEQPGDDCNYVDFTLPQPGEPFDLRDDIKDSLSRTIEGDHVGGILQLVDGAHIANAQLFINARQAELSDEAVCLIANRFIASRNEYYCKVGKRLLAAAPLKPFPQQPTTGLQTPSSAQLRTATAAARERSQTPTSATPAANRLAPALQTSPHASEALRATDTTTMAFTASSAQVAATATEASLLASTLSDGRSQGSVPPDDDDGDQRNDNAENVDGNKQPEEGSPIYDDAERTVEDRRRQSPDPSQVPPTKKRRREAQLDEAAGGGKQKRIRKAANSRQQNTHTTIPSTPQNSSPASQKTKTPGRKGTKNGPSPPEKSDAALELEQLKQYAKAAKELLDAGNYSSASMVSQRTVRRLTKAVIKGRLSSALPPIEGRVDINLPLLRLKRSKSFWDRVTDNTFREQAARWGDARQPYYKMRRDKLRKRYKKVMRTIPEELKDGTKQKHDRKRKRLPNLWSDLIHLFYGHRGPQDNSDIEHVRREYRIGLGLRALVYRFGVGVLCLQPASKETNLASWSRKVYIDWFEQKETERVFVFWTNAMSSALVEAVTASGTNDESAEQSRRSRSLLAAFCKTPSMERLEKCVDGKSINIGIIRGAHGAGTKQSDETDYSSSDDDNGEESDDDKDEGSGEKEADDEDEGNDEDESNNEDEGNNKDEGNDEGTGRA